MQPQNKSQYFLMQGFSLAQHTQQMTLALSANNQTSLDAYTWSIFILLGLLAILSLFHTGIIVLNDILVSTFYISEVIKQS